MLHCKIHGKYLLTQGFKNSHLWRELLAVNDFSFAYSYVTFLARPSKKSTC